MSHAHPAKHTPGPWSWNEIHNVIDDSHDRVCTGTYVTDLSDKINPADARLIAAAPELLEALKAATLLLAETLNYEGGDKDTIGAVEQADAVIAKAEGR